VLGLLASCVDGTGSTGGVEQSPSAVAFSSQSDGTKEAPVRQVVFGDGSAVLVEIAADPATRAQGLMFRPSLSPDRGMLFLFRDKAEHSFWMKNTLIPLDILWVDETATVVHIEADVPPCQADPCPSYAPSAQAVAVLELAAGQSAARGIRTGDVLQFRGGIENIVVR
jgi:uncharacterized membrane protein (UPF0127 family)